MSKQQLFHGGDLQQAAKEYQREQFVDLSTGINPTIYPLSGLSAQVFKQLPYLQEPFLRAAEQYYQQTDFVPIAGSQLAIDRLPSLLADYPIIMPSHGYQEHQHAWQQYRQHYYPAFDFEKSKQFIEQAIEKKPRQHILIINPNNPTGLLFDPALLIEWANRIDTRAYLIVDEAFIDCYSEHSVLQQPTLPHNVIVLRSFGKFFGLAGLRLGFFFANKNLCQQMAKQQSLWAINGPAQAIASQALLDHSWIKRNQQQIKLNQQFTQLLFSRFVLFQQEACELSCLKIFSSALFISYLFKTKVAQAILTHLAQQGVLVRLIVVDQQYTLLRVGLLNRADKASLKLCLQALTSLSSTTLHVDA